MQWCEPCGGTGTTPIGDVCLACRGRRVVLSGPVACTYCKGKGREPAQGYHACHVCKGKGWIQQTTPFTLIPPKRLLTTGLRRALDDILDDKAGEQAGGGYLHGVVAGLVVNGKERFGDPEQVRLWINDLLRSGAIILDHDGIWQETSKGGVRVWNFVEEEQAA